MSAIDHRRILGRLQLCEEDIRERPFSHPTAVAWYYEDVSWLLREIERLEAKREDEASDPWTVSGAAAAAFEALERENEA